MIKKIILTLGVVIVAFLGVSFGLGAYQPVGVNSSSSAVNSNYDITFLKGGGLLSNYLGISKGILALRDNVLFWRTPDGLPYAYLQSNDTWIGIRQGYFDKYFLCDNLSGSVLSGCTVGGNINLSGNNSFTKEAFKNFFTNVVAGDYVYYNYAEERYNGATWNYTVNYLVVCWSSDVLNKSLCFMGGGCTNGKSCKEGGIDIGGLTNSLGYTNLTYGGVSSSDIGPAPGQFGYDGGGTPSPSGDLTNISCPTISQLIANYNTNGFSSGLCYSSSKIFNGSSFVDVDPVSIFDLFSSKDDFISSLNKFATYCESSVYNSNVCAEAFSGEDLRFNLISKIPNNTNVVGGRKSLYTYCNLYNYDPNATTCVASGVSAELGSDYTVDDVIHAINNGNYTVYSPVTNNTEYNTVFNNGSGGYIYSGDVISNTLNLFGKFTSLFKQQTGNTNGILPTFILIPFIIIVLFKLFKK